MLHTCSSFKHFDKGCIAPTIQDVGADVLGDGGVGDGPIVPYTAREFWVHVSLLYESPWGPTFTQLQRRAAETHDGDAIPLGSVMSVDVDGRSQLAHMNLWELLRALDIRKAITMKCYRLVASAGRPADQLEPWKQRVQPMTVIGVAFWGGSELEEAKHAVAAAKRRRRKPRGPRAPRRDDGGGDGGAAADDEAAGEGEDVDEEIEDIAEEISGGGDDPDAELDTLVDPFALPADEEALADGGARSEDDESESSDSSSGSSASASASDLIDEEESYLSDSDDEQGFLRVDIPGFHKPGNIFITHKNDRQEFYAVCTCKGLHGKKCIMSRSAKEGDR